MTALFMKQLFTFYFTWHLVIEVAPFEYKYTFSTFIEILRMAYLNSLSDASNKEKTALYPAVEMIRSFIALTIADRILSNHTNY